MKINNKIQYVLTLGLLLFSLLFFKLMGITQCTDNSQATGRAWIDNNHTEILSDGTRITVIENVCKTVNFDSQCN